MSRVENTKHYTSSLKLSVTADNYNAKCSIATLMLSVCLSVCLSIFLPACNVEILWSYSSARVFNLRSPKIWGHMQNNVISLASMEVQNTLQLTTSKLAYSFNFDRIYAVSNYHIHTIDES